MRPLLIDAKSGNEVGPRGGPVLLSSAQSPWRGMYLEQHAGGPIEPVLVMPRKHLLIVQFEESTMFECRMDGRSKTVRVAPGQVSLFPAFTPYAAHAADTRKYLALALDPSFVLCAANGAIAGSRLQLAPRHGVEDPLTRGVALALKAEVEAGYPGGRLYGDSLATALSIHLVQRFSDFPLTARPPRGLAQSQMRRAIEFMQEHLAEDISLGAIAAAAGLSLFHFARSFRESMGLTPHQYLIRRRVERARELLITSKASIAEAASRAGFCDQSHFTRHFRRAFGVPPKAFLRQFVSGTESSR